MNRVYFPTDSSFRVAFGLCVNRIAQHNNQQLLVEKDISTLCDVVKNAAKLNDIVVNYIGFGSIRDSDVEWITNMHKQYNLWHEESQEQSWLGLWEYAKTFVGE